MKKQIPFILGIICIVSACKIDTDGLPKIQSNALLNGKWFVKSSVTTNSSTSIVDVYSGYTVKDYYVFNTDNTTQISYSAPDTLINTRYSYTNVSAIEKVTVGDPTDLEVFTITKLTTDSLIMSTTLDISATISGSLSSGTTTVSGSSSGSLSVPIVYKLARK